LDHTNWNEASAAASATSYQGISGHLATVTNQAENDFVLSLIQDVNASVWLGGFDANSGQGEDDWSWVTGEPFSYSNWQ
jgi:hypothetical protein